MRPGIGKRQKEVVAGGMPSAQLQRRPVRVDDRIQLVNRAVAVELAVNTRQDTTGIENRIEIIGRIQQWLVNIKGRRKVTSQIARARGGCDPVAGKLMLHAEAIGLGLRWLDIEISGGDG